MKRIYYVKVLMLLLIAISFLLCNGKSTTLEKQQNIVDKVKQITDGSKTDVDKARSIFMFVRDSIKFGWVYPQNIPAQEVLNNRKGVCMQKTILLVEMARISGIKARFHFMHVDKTALQDFLPHFAYKRWVSPFPHTFPELFLNGKWVSMEATFDKELHNICIDKKLNFGRNDTIVKNISIDFSSNGVKGHQQYVVNKSKKSIYGNDMSEFSKFMHKNVPWWKKKMQPFIFKKADKIMTEIRTNKNK